MTIKDQGASINIKLSQIVPSKTNPRKHFGEEMLKEMAASIEQHGILQPILVRTPRDGKYEIVAGETRYRAACMTSLEEAPCLVRELSDFEALEIQVLENLHRNDLTPMEEAQGFKQLLDKSEDIAAYTIDQLADKIGKSRTYVYDSLKLLELPDAAVTALNSGELNRSTALLVARLTPDVQTSAIAKLKSAAEDGNPIPYREAKQLVRNEERASELNAALDQMIAEARAEGKTVLDLRDKKLKKEWAEFGLSSMGYRKKPGWLIDNSTMTSGDGYRAYVHEVLAVQPLPDGTIYLADVEYFEAKIVAVYPEPEMWARFNGAVADGHVRKPGTAQAATFDYDFRRQQKEKEQRHRTAYATRIIEKIMASRTYPPPELSLRVSLMVATGFLDSGTENYTLLTAAGIEDENALAAAINNASSQGEMARLAIVHFVGCNAWVPWNFFHADFEPAEEDQAWEWLKKIAEHYSLPPYISPAAEQPPTPPAAAQAQEDIAPEKPDPTIEAAGELSEEEASLAGEPAAQAEEQTPPAARTAAQKRMDDIKARTLARKARKESAKADVSNTAPPASAAGETNRSEVAA
ncbi:ParB/RepB/Spo0J family partition protein [Methylobacillus flagellatus]|uniref:ParB/RepB/Spo0J family partition protein n=1 Tax=Methylobacillus flagellatus TaxID=405 RepID=UPI00285417FF|nr:ParB/RepB/Spo0J family partition protein [Methylobacillus flagellatus]MDR5170700.1 ParB/RepB/Spo0J family partition protein [Methylobacillus flagellatus]